MRTQSYAVEPGGPARLEVRRIEDASAWEVLLDRKEIARFATREELVAGRTITLSNGSRLLVKLDTIPSGRGPTQQLRVELDGLPLTEPTTPTDAVRQAVTVLRAFGVLTIGVVLYLFASSDDAGLRLGCALGVLDGGVSIALGQAVARHRRWALIAGIVLFSIELLVGALALGACPVILRVIGIVVLVRALGALRDLERVDSAAVARIFE